MSETQKGGLLGIDSATKSGFAYLFPGGVPIFESYRAGKQGADHGEVGHAFRNRLAGLVMLHRPRHVVFEAPYVPLPRAPRFQAQGDFMPRSPAKGPPPMNMETVYRLCGLCFMIEQVAVEFGLKPLKIETQVWTKWFCGAGRFKGGRDAKKQAVMAECRRRGYAVTDDNAADAIGIALYAEWCLYPELGARRMASTIAKGAQTQASRQSSLALTYDALANGTDLGIA